MIIKIIAGTCVVVFVVTSAITILGIIGKVKVEKKYLDKLFVALLLEVVAISLFGYNEFLTKENDPTYIRITFPTQDVKLAGSNSIVMNGLALMNNETQSIECKYNLGGDTDNFTLNKTGPRDGFTFKIPIDTSKLPSRLYLKCYLKDQDKIIAVDSIPTPLLISN